MKLDSIALVAVVVGAVIYGVVFATGLVIAVPFGFLGLIPLALVVGLVVAVIVQRLRNREDDHYDKNIHQ